MASNLSEFERQLFQNPFYQQLIQGRRNRRPTRPAFVITDDGCFVYDGSLNKKGYARRGKDGDLVHRAAWRTLIGAIPQGYEVHHMCHRTDCARVDHLMCLSKEEHALLEGRPLKLDAEDVEEILRQIDAGARHTDIATRFGIVRPYISLIKYGERWASVVFPFWARLGRNPDGTPIDSKRAA